MERKIFKQYTSNGAHYTFYDDGNCVVKYADAVEVRMNNGTTILQRNNGVRETTFLDGTKRVAYPCGTVLTRWKDGTQVDEFDGVRFTQRPDGTLLYENAGVCTQHRVLTR
jgi:hypothetical protein